MTAPFTKTATPIAAVLAAITVAPAQAESSEHAVSIAGHVPVVCRAQFRGGTTLIRDNRVILGRLAELCNVEAGYRIVLSHSVDLQGVVRIGASEVALSPTGETIIVESSIARIRSSEAELTVSEGDLPARVSLRIEPMGGFI